MTVDGRSKDGIHVKANDVRLIFSVYRGPKDPNGGTEYSQPYPYTQEAIQNLVYQHNTGPWTLAMHNLIREKLRGFPHERRAQPR